MFCSTPDYQPDFFNNVAAVAVVLMFTKVVVRRSRRNERREHYDLAHGGAIVAALMAISASLWATETCSQAWILHLLAWLGVGAAGIFLSIDIWRDDVRKSGS